MNKFTVNSLKVESSGFSHSQRWEAVLVNQTNETVLIVGYIKFGSPTDVIKMRLLDLVNGEVHFPHINFVTEECK